jgi:uncharacterized protein (TIGR02996 family)
MNTLVAARDALDAGDVREGIRHLLGFWRDAPVPVVADQIAELDAALRPDLIDDQQTWLDAAIAPSDDDFGVIARSLLVTPRARAEERLVAAVRAGWPPDPRLGVVLQGAMTKVRWTANSSRPTWEVLFALLDQSEDPRFLDWVPAFDVRPAQREWLVEHFQTPRTRARFPAGAPSLSAADAVLWDEVVAASAPPAVALGVDDTLESLLAGVYADPTSDGPRLVLADWLLERGDPRGEFIAAQCVGRPLSRELVALLKKHEHEWTGPIGSVLAKKRSYRRGFLAAATVRFKQPQDVTAVGEHPAWATVDELGCGKGIAHVPHTLSGLRVLNEGLSDAGIRALCSRTTPWAIEELHIAVERRASCELLMATELFPALRVLGLGGEFNTCS